MTYRSGMDACLRGKCVLYCAPAELPGDDRASGEGGVTYTDEQRAEAVALYAEVGPSEVERRLGIPKGTVTKWAQADGAETSFLQNASNASKALHLKWAEYRGVMVDDIAGAALKALARVEAHIEADNDGKAKNYATTMAILVDKAQLLSGGATNRTETVSAIDHEIESLLSQMDERERTSA